MNSLAVLSSFCLLVCGKGLWISWGKTDCCPHPGWKARIFPVPEGFLRKASDLHGKSWWISRGRPKIYIGEARGFLEKGLGFIEESRRSSRGNPKVYVGKAGGFLEEKATAPHTPHTPTPYDFSRKASDLCRESLRIFKRKARISLEKAGASRHPGWKARFFPENAGQWSGPFISIPIFCGLSKKVSGWGLHLSSGRSLGFRV